MKRILFIILACVSTSVMNAQELQSKFKVFRDFCFEARTAYVNKDADRLADCVMQMYEMTQNTENPWTPWKNLKTEEVQDSTKYEDHLLFDVEWMDNIVAKWTEKDSTLIDISNPMRGNGLLYVNYLIPANSTQTFTTSGRGLMTIMVIAEDETDIQLRIDQDSCDHHYVSPKKANKGCQYDVWQTKALRMSPISIKVTNPSDHDIVCVFVTD